MFLFHGNYTGDLGGSEEQRRTGKEENVPDQCLTHCTHLHARKRQLLLSDCPFLSCHSVASSAQLWQCQSTL